jgi:LPXTG-motif cell wall-anchored protein
MTRAVIRVLLGSALVCLTAAVTSAQTSTMTQSKKFEVISVDGNRLVVKLPEGTREMNVADDFRFNVDGKMLSVHELKPGMAGTATITTKTTTVPVTVTEVKNGTVMQVSGSSIIVRTDEGIKMFTQGDLDKRGVKIMKDGMPAQVSDFHTNDKLTATIITSKPPRIMTEQQVQATLARSGNAASAGSAPPAASTAAPRQSTATSGQSTASSRRTTGATGQTASGGSGAKLPKTASDLPLLALIGLASLAAGLGLTAWRRRLAH